jgi:hypothetical protein
MRYARVDLDLKRQALAQVFPEALGISSPQVSVNFVANGIRRLQ